MTLGTEEPMLSLEAIVVPTRVAEIDHIRRNLVLWSSPHFSPSSEGSDCRPRLNFVFNNDDARQFEDELRQSCAKLGLERHFREIAFTFLDLSGLDDLYSRSELGPFGPGGYKAGPNNQFFNTMELYREARGAVFYMETDCVPIRSGWIEALQNVLRQHQSAFVIGSAYRGGGRLDREIFRHVNGNAIYCVGQAGFGEFLAQWKEWLFRLIASGSKSLAYDVLIETVFSLAQKNQEANDFYMSHLGRVQYSNVVQNISAPQDAFLTDPKVVKQVRDRYDETFMMHGAIFARAVETLIAGGGELHPDNLLVEPSPKPLFGSKTHTKLGDAKRWCADWLRDRADWLEHNNIKHAIMRIFPPWRR